MSNRTEAIELIEKLADENKWEKNRDGYWVYSETCPCVIARQAIAKLKEHPSASEFTKRFRATCEVAYRDCNISEKQIQNVLNNTGLLGLRVRLLEGMSAAKDGLEACDRLDRSESSRKELLDALKKYGNHQEGCILSYKYKPTGLRCTCGFDAITTNNK